ncbi:MAG: hypothetical protein M1822_000875 [Bathelium mastoideum]|nr:MAG: hypothetical protein M1822_000875 [Bathelium mastoideum]
MASSDSENKAPEVLAIVWILLVISGFIILARVYTRVAVVRKTALDDHLMVLAWILGLIFNVFITMACKWGLGRHFWTLDQMHQVNAMHWNFVSQPFGILAGTIGRISFSVSLLRIIGPVDKIKKYVLYFIIIFQMMINFSTIILIFVQCGKTVDAIWDPSLIKTAGAKCWSPDVQTYYGFFQSSVNAVTDLVLTILPLWVLWNTQLKPAIKATLACLLGLSVLAMAATVVKTYELKNISARKDFTMNITGLYIWTAVEFNIIFIDSSIPTLKPLFRSVRMFNKSSSRGGTYRLSAPVNKSSTHAKPAYRRDSWDFSPSSHFNGFKKDKGDSSSEENILPPGHYSSLSASQDIKKTTVITVDREDASLSSHGDAVQSEAQEHGRAPSTEPKAWAGGHAA